MLLPFYIRHSCGSEPCRQIARVARIGKIGTNVMKYLLDRCAYGLALKEEMTPTISV
jgi:hypothetical protein